MLLQACCWLPEQIWGVFLNPSFFFPCLSSDGWDTIGSLLTTSTSSFLLLIFPPGLWVSLDSPRWPLMALISFQLCLIDQASMLMSASSNKWESVGSDSQAENNGKLPFTSEIKFKLPPPLCRGGWVLVCFESCSLHSVSSPSLGFGDFDDLECIIISLISMSFPPCVISIFHHPFCLSERALHFEFQLLRHFSYNFSWFVICYPCFVVNYSVFLHSISFRPPESLSTIATNWIRPNHEKPRFNG